MKYNIAIKETLERVIEIDAKTAGEALAIAHSMYDNSEVVLDADDYVGYEIHLSSQSK